VGFVSVLHFPDEHILSDIGVGIILIAWFTSIGHGFAVRRLYLRILAKQKLEYESQQLRDQERLSNRPMTNGQTVPVNEPSEEKEDQQLLGPININRVRLDEITLLPGIHSFLAKEIIQIRNKEGQFKTIEDFALKTKIKPHILSKAKSYIVFSDKDLQEKIAEKELEKEVEAQAESSPKKGRIVDY